MRNQYCSVLDKNKVKLEEYNKRANFHRKQQSSVHPLPLFYWAHSPLPLSSKPVRFCFIYLSHSAQPFKSAQLFSLFFWSHDKDTQTETCVVLNFSRSHMPFLSLVYFLTSACKDAINLSSFYWRLATSYQTIRMAIV